MLTVERTNINIKAKSERVVPLYIDLNTESRISNLANRISSMEDDLVKKTLDKVLNEFEKRHIKLKEILLQHYKNVEPLVDMPEIKSLQKKLLLGTYLTKEYSVESAALFNPSIVPHPNQENLNEGELRFVLSLRATGEGHISSIEFRTGKITKEGKITLDPMSSEIVSLSTIENTRLQKKFLIDRIGFYDNVNRSMLDLFPEEFSRQEALQIIGKLSSKNQKTNTESVNALLDIFDANYDISFDKNIEINNRVIFPRSNAESMGMEDVRFVKFFDGDKSKYIGTYTAYNGKNIRPQMIETEDFTNFKIRSLYGNAAFNKGMALFPEKINGKYAMIGRQDGESISIMYSDDLYFWDTYKVIQKSQHDWDFLQLGNCGSPIKTSKGWLLLTHAVGPLRKYVMSASLLDLKNPEKVLNTLDEPFFSPNESERIGYVPNVVYTCGFLKHYDKLIIPYALSDISSSFGIVNVDDILNELKPNKSLCEKF
ncbi:MAG: glycoside hydrolase family 130 protein [Bacteroidetes bacterium]|nr:glycoside hydrolase family 130 protein [Bacteroidota bacterium]